MFALALFRPGSKKRFEEKFGRELDAVSFRMCGTRCELYAIFSFFPKPPDPGSFDIRTKKNGYARSKTGLMSSRNKVYGVKT